MLPGCYDSPEELTDDLVDFIRTPLVLQISGGIHVNDALIHDAWGRLPSEWTAYWDSLADHRFAQRDMIDSIDEDEDLRLRTIQDCPAEGQGGSPKPDSLDRWLKHLKSVSLPRTRRQGPALALPEALTIPMKPKKINEVSVAAAHIHSVCQSNDITHIIDIGSGQGYLSVALAFLFPSLRILAIDGSESQVAGSKAFAASLGIRDDRLRHIIRYIDGSASLISEMEAWAGGQRCMLVGLHACGNLSEHMLGYFDRCPFISHLAAIGCCYNHIVMRSDSCPDGFPISDRLRRRDVSLSPTALMAGSQAPNNWERLDLTKDTSVYSKKQFYRALLEKMFHDKAVHVREAENRANWGIRKRHLADFESFTRRAMHCLGIDQSRIRNEDIAAYETRYASQEGRISILWTLSVLCCKAFESIIALDRYWFLVERGAEDVDLVPIFEYRVSPRNLMIVAEKRHERSNAGSIPRHREG